jgi:hypothetical protein
MENGHGKYSLKNELLNGVVLPRAVTGQYIARAQLSLVERAYAAADLHKGNVLLVQPTVLQSAALYRVNPTYVHCALKRPNDRKLVESGAVPFTLPVVKALPAPVSPQQRLADVVAEVGVTGTLNMLAVLDKDGQLAA